MPFDPVTQDKTFSSSEYPASMVPVKIYSAGYKLLGTFFLAEGKVPHPNIILLQGFPGNENNFDIAHAMRRAGWNILVFNYRGLWGSEGKFSWNNSLEDVHAAIEFILTNDSINDLRIDTKKIVLAGYSFGGFAALKTCIEYSEIQNAASFAGFNFGHFAKIISANNELYNLSLERLQGSAEIFNISPEKLLHEMITCSDNFNLNYFADELAEKNLLIIRSKFDTLAPAEFHHLPFIQALRNSNAKNLIDITIDSGHSFSDSRIKLSRILLNWMNKIAF
jgi:hypothetical protein